MNNKIVMFSGIIGIVFGILISGTLGITFFPEEDIITIPNDSNNDGSIKPELDLDEEAFQTAYNLTESIYIPIYGDDVYDLMNDGESFILYIGRDTCPYCQQLVPDLMESATEHGYTEIYHVDILDTNNATFIQQQGISSVPFTVVVVNGEATEAFIGYRSKTDIDTILDSIE